MEGERGKGRWWKGIKGKAEEEVQEGEREDEKEERERWEEIGEKGG